MYVISKTKIYRRQLETVAKCLNKGPVYPDQAIFKMYIKTKLYIYNWWHTLFSINIIISLYASNYYMLKEMHRCVFYVGKVVKGRKDIIPKNEEGPDFDQPWRWRKFNNKKESKANQILLLIPWNRNTFNDWISHFKAMPLIKGDIICSLAYRVFKNNVRNRTEETEKVPEV